MTRVSLPSGGWADLRPVADITERQRRPIKRLQSQLAAIPAFAEAVSRAEKLEKSGKALSLADQKSIAAGMGEAFDPLEELNDRLIVAAVRGWSFTFDVSFDSVLDVPSRDLDALREHVSPYLAQLMPDFDPTPDKESPTGLSTVSAVR